MAVSKHIEGTLLHEEQWELNEFEIVLDFN